MSRDSVLHHHAIINEFSPIVTKKCIKTKLGCQIYTLFVRIWLTDLFFCLLNFSQQQKRCFYTLLNTKIKHAIQQTILILKLNMDIVSLQKLKSRSNKVWILYEVVLVCMSNIYSCIMTNRTIVQKKLIFLLELTKMRH